MVATVNTNVASTGESIGSPRSPPRRASFGAARTSSPTWNQIVCGAGPEAEALFAHPPPPPPLPSSESLAMAVVPEFGYEGLNVSEEGCNTDEGNRTHSASFRQLWIWMHPSASTEGYNALRTACQKQMDDTGVVVTCLSLEGQLASNESLIKDISLRQNMDEHGWVPVQLIANFKKDTFHPSL